jgi:hypothetical protein
MVDNPETGSYTRTMRRSSSIHIPVRSAVHLTGVYIKGLLGEQVKSVAFIILYLIIFQRFILGLPLSGISWIAFGIAMVVIGLTFFLEGIRFGLMPLGEQVGVTLPARYRSIFVIIVFGFLVGFGSTLAEPAIAALREIGSTVPAWSAPLLYLLLQRYTSLLIWAIGAGVGIAVILGLLRFHYGFSIKILIMTVIPMLLAVTVMAYFDDKLQSIIGLAWDSGAVTTGAVTVPLVLAIGIGVSRASGRNEGGRGGFGIIMLASALPIVSVLVLGFAMRENAPDPRTEHDFFLQEHREQAFQLFDSEKSLQRYAFRIAGEEGRKAFFSENADYRNALRSLVLNEGFRRDILGDMSFSEWLRTRSSENEREYLSGFFHREVSEKRESRGISSILSQKTADAARAIIPLTGLLLIVLFMFLRERPRYRDEVSLGIILAIIGMTCLTSGISIGLTPLGEAVGEGLPRSFQASEQVSDRIVIEEFDPGIVIRSIQPDGKKTAYFYLERDGRLERIQYFSERYNPEKRQYEHIIFRKPLFKAELTFLGIALVCLFAFGLGYGSSLAEPALHALGKTVEEMTIGRVREYMLVRVVAIGVGIGILMGIMRIIFFIPTIWLLLPPYFLLLPMSLIGDEDFVGIAWDSGGVTTGPVTVPLVLAMGMGIGAELHAPDSFGVLALGSVYPIFTVLVYGLWVRINQRRSVLEKREELNNG